MAEGGGNEETSIYFNVKQPNGCNGHKTPDRYKLLKRLLEEYCAKYENDDDDDDYEDDDYEDENVDDEEFDANTEPESVINEHQPADLAYECVSKMFSDRFTHEDYMYFWERLNTKAEWMEPLLHVIKNYYQLMTVVGYNKKKDPFTELLEIKPLSSIVGRILTKTKSEIWTPYSIDEMYQTMSAHTHNLIYMWVYIGPINAYLCKSI